MKHTISITAAALALGAIAAPLAAHADVSPVDQASPLIVVTKADPTGDAEGPNQTESDQVALAAADVTELGVTVDRTADTVTLRLTTVGEQSSTPANLRRIMTVEIRASRREAAYFAGRQGQPRVVGFGTDDGGFTPCEGATYRTSGSVATMTLPFSCLGGLTSGRIRAGMLLEERKGGSDTAYDQSPRTRELPLTHLDAPSGRR
mgnify:CR=1 FL=1